MGEPVSEKQKTERKPYHGFDIEELDLSEMPPDPDSGLTMSCEGIFDRTCMRIPDQQE